MGGLPSMIYRIFWMNLRKCFSENCCHCIVRATLSMTSSSQWRVPSVVWSVYRSQMSRAARAADFTWIGNQKDIQSSSEETTVTLPVIRGAPKYLISLVPCFQVCAVMYSLVSTGTRPIFFEILVNFQSLSPSKDCGKSQENDRGQFQEIFPVCLPPCS